MLPPPRNQAIECFRIIASLFVVFLHTPFGGSLGQVATTLGRYAVPMFFAISGYYSFHAKGSRLLSKCRQMIVLYLSVALGNLVWGCVNTEINGGSTIAFAISWLPEIDEIAGLLFLSLPPYLGQLWYVLSMVILYGILWGYVSFFEDKPIDYRPFYIVGACLLLMHLQFGGLDGDGIWVNKIAPCRGPFFTGFPMFAMGLFLREYREQIFRIFRLSSARLSGLIFLGIVLALLQRFGNVNTGNMEYGTIIGTAGLILLLTSHPRLVPAGSMRGRVISHFGFWSTGIYLIHVSLIPLYERYALPAAVQLLGTAEPYCRPLLIFFASLLLTIVWEPLWKQVLCKRKSRIA